MIQLNKYYTVVQKKSLKWCLFRFIILYVYIITNEDKQLLRQWNPQGISFEQVKPRLLHFYRLFFRKIEWQRAASVRNKTLVLLKKKMFSICNTFRQPIKPIRSFAHFAIVKQCFLFELEAVSSTSLQ